MLLLLSLPGVAWGQAAPSVGGAVSLHQGPGVQDAERPTERPSERNAERPTDWYAEVGVRFVTLPDFIADGLFRVHTSMAGVAGGAGLRWRQPNGDEWRFSLDYTPLSFADGNWLQTGLPAASAVHLSWDLSFVSLGASYTWRFEILARRTYFTLTLGAAVGVLVGDVSLTDVVPTCEEPVERCPHWQSVSRRTLELPSRVLPVPIASAGVDLRVVSELWLRIEVGLIGAPFAGMSLALPLPD